MPRRFALVPAIVAVLLVVMASAGCAQRASEPVHLTSADEGSTQRLATGQQLVVSLDSNPTTGYRWAVDGSLPSQLKQIGAPKYSSDTGAVGAGGTEVWTFSGQSAGTGTLKLKYWRSFEPTATPADTFTVNVEVK